MAVKFPLKMAGGTMVRTIEELREHFDLASALAYYKDGRLEKWLENGYYDEEAQKVAALDTASDNIAGELCAILGVSYSVSELEQADLGNISNRHERLERLKQYTVDDAILAAVDRVAFTQEELDDLVSKRSFASSSSVSGSTFTTATSCWSSPLAGSNSMDPRTVIYLCGEHFAIPGDVGGITYVGINSPTVTFDGNTVAAGIDLQGIRCDLEEYIDDYMDGISEGKRFFDLFADNLTLGMKLLGMAAENGSAKMQTFLGACYGGGRGVEVNFAEAMKWYKTAATQGYASAQLIVANAYKAGSVVQEDPFEAVKWYKKAAEQGITEAQVSLIDCYRYINEDDSKALKRCKKAAEQGLAEAQFVLGECYYLGRGVEKNISEALRWYKEAAEQGVVEAQLTLGEYYATDAEENRSEAEKWYKKAAEQGVVEAQLMLGICYWSGDGAEWDEEAACKWFLRAAEQGCRDAQYYLSLIYRGRTDEEAIKWLQKEVAKGNREAKAALLNLIYPLKKDFPKYSKSHRWGIIHKRAEAEIYGIRGFLIWDYIIYNEISFEDTDSDVFSLFTSASSKKTEVEWNQLVNKYRIK